jgi:TRAP-type C4-dicarboxylate transport system permease large subunit
MGLRRDRLRISSHSHTVSVSTSGCMGMGLFSPPFGVVYYAACAISKVHTDEGARPIAGYIAALPLGLLVVIFVPWISTGFL